MYKKSIATKLLFLTSYFMHASDNELHASLMLHAHDRDLEIGEFNLSDSTGSLSLSDRHESGRFQPTLAARLCKKKLITKYVLGGIVIAGVATSVTYFGVDISGKLGTIIAELESSGAKLDLLLNITTKIAEKLP